MIVGNGFDISALNYLGVQGATTYQAFFYYLKSIGFTEDNILYKTMDSLRQEFEQQTCSGRNLANWSNFEERLSELLSQKDCDAGKLENDLTEIQKQFSTFLNNTVDSTVINDLNTRLFAHDWSIKTFSSFLSDIPSGEYKYMALPMLCGHYHIFNFDVFNLNFTPLLDCYLYLDKRQHKPERKTVDTNFDFEINRNGFDLDTSVAAGIENDKVLKNYKLFTRPNERTNCSGYLVTSLHHPHGQQDIPRSLLFGVESEELMHFNASPTSLPNSINRNDFSKPYLAQLDRKYGSKIRAARTFILFGTSLGSSDRWWWWNILDAAYADDYSDIIIYKFLRTPDDTFDKNEFRRAFIVSNLPHSIKNDSKRGEAYISNLVDKIHVVTYLDPQDLHAFGFAE